MTGLLLKNEFYKAGDILWGTNVFKISPFHVLWPIPANAIDSNQGGTINQNKGYIGYEKYSSFNSHRRSTIF